MIQSVRGSFGAAIAVNRLSLIPGTNDVPNPDFPLNCAKCGTRLTYRWPDGDTHIYSCVKHGRVVLPPSGRVRLDDPEDSAVKH